MNFDTPNLLYTMKEYRPIKVPNPFTNYYIFGGVFLFIAIITLVQGNSQNTILVLSILAVLGIVIFLVIRTVKYTVLLRFENNVLRIEYLDYRKKNFFMQIPYAELSAKLSTEKVKARSFQVLNITRNGERKIRIDENNSNFLPNQLFEIYEDILKLNPSKG